MKKLLLAGAIALTGLMNAQEYKPQAGDVSAEFVLNGGLDNTSVGFRKGGDVDAAIRGRYFKADNLAYRGGVYLNFVSGNDSSATDLELAFGLEKHFKGTKRLSPYVGGEAFVGVQAKKDVDTETAFGARGVFGADYYFVKNVYLGAEAGLGFKYNTDSELFTIAPSIAGIKLGFIF